MSSLKVFMRYLWQHNRRATLSVLLLSTFAGIFDGLGMTLILPMMSQLGVGNADGQFGAYLKSFYEFLGLPLNLLTVCATLVTLVLLQNIFTFWSSCLGARTSYELTSQLRKKLFEGYFQSGWSFFVKSSHGILGNQIITEAERAGSAFLYFSSAFVYLILAFVYIGLALKLSTASAFVFLVSAALLTFVLKRIISDGKRYGEQLTVINQSLASQVNENIGAAKIIKATNAEKVTAEKFGKSSDELAEATIESAVNNFSIKAFSEPMGVVFLCFCIYFSSQFLKVQGSELLLLLVIFIRLSPRVFELQRMWNLFLRQAPAFESTLKLIQDCQTQEEKIDLGRPQNFLSQISIQNLSFEYDPARPILQNIDLDIQKGQMIGLAGTSGGGKSTLVDLVLGLYRPKSGRILIDGTDLATMSLAHWRGQISYVSQENVLFHDTIMNNIRWSKLDATDEEVMAAARLAHADSFIQDCPEKYQTIVGDRGVRLSGGQRQRLALARAIIRKPRLLILDEATSALDNESEKAVRDAIENLRSTTTILMIAHRLNTLKTCDQILILNQGKISDQGKWADLFDVEGRHRRLMEASDAL
ncbi:MAG: ABC transporter ATP-binding protein [Bdellovibrionales bacterium]